MIETKLFTAEEIGFSPDGCTIMRLVRGPFTFDIAIFRDHATGKVFIRSMTIWRKRYRDDYFSHENMVFNYERDRARRRHLCTGTDDPVLQEHIAALGLTLGISSFAVVVEEFFTPNAAMGDAAAYVPSGIEQPRPALPYRTDQTFTGSGIVTKRGAREDFRASA